MKVGELLHHGISHRKFSRSWTIADDVVVQDAKMENGMLLIHLEHVVPEEKKPRVIKHQIKLDVSPIV